MCVCVIYIYIYIYMYISYFPAGDLPSYSEGGRCRRPFVDKGASSSVEGVWRQGGLNSAGITYSIKYNALS